MPSIIMRKVERAGHMIPFEDVEAFFAALKGFL
jgi:hypothetical protein